MLRRHLAAYAFRSERGEWHGQPRLLQKGSYREALTFGSIGPPADRYNPLGGQMFLIRYGPFTHDEEVSVYKLQIRQNDGSPLNLRMTHRVQDAPSDRRPSVRPSASSGNAPGNTCGAKSTASKFASSVAVGCRGQGILRPGMVRSACVS